MPQYRSLRDVLIDSFSYIPEYKHPFYGAFTQEWKRTAIKISLEDMFVKRFAENEPKYFRTIDNFVNSYLLPYFLKGQIRIDIFNKITCLSILLPDIINFLNTKKPEISCFTTSLSIFQDISGKDKKIKKEKLPLVFYPNLATLLVTDEINYNLKQIKNPKQREIEEENWEIVKILTTECIINLGKYIKFFKENPDLNNAIKIKPFHVFSYEGKPYFVKYFDGMNAKVILILGDRGTGKTVGVLRFISALLELGYTIIVFGEDMRQEMRWAYFPIKQPSKKSKKIKKNKEDSKSLMNYYQKVFQQGTKPKGMPITIFCDNPQYPIEKQINDFGGTKKEWENLNGVVLFESKQYSEEKIKERETEGDKTSKSFKIYRKSRLAQIMEDFSEWRATNKKKKVALCLNEAQNLIGSQVDKDTYGIYIAAEKLFTNIRGFGVPVILNTQYMSKLRREGKQADILFCSQISDFKEMENIKRHFPAIRQKKDSLETPIMKTNHHFIKVENGRVYKVKFLLPPFMIENKIFNLDDLFKKRK